ncbi:MAG: hypothetical protein A2340_09225 [Lentisphaerae bacterium RIFOXYB12_FULL_60_10]|nr:MAG: hypothetical protein A2269_09315 [Lentisphaerae bacterium RIFOXYA12_FULL_60_10]OGV85436.1 MAG: hypothetical protein A2340_09225 [Lentisphaerae bacterium RIFOXYB12_FULL_60_10]
MQIKRKQVVNWMMAGWLLALAPVADAALKAEAIPLFQWRGRVVTSAGVKPDGQVFSIGFGVKDAARPASNDQWTAWSAFDIEHARHYTGPHAYPNTYMRGFPLVTKPSFNKITEPAHVEMEIRFDATPDQVIALSGELFGPTLGVLIFQDAAGNPSAATMAGYNQRYWEVFRTAVVKPEERPKHFPIVDRFIAGDNDLIALREGIETLSAAGFSAIMLPPDRRQREILLTTGNRRTAWAVYNPPGYAFDYGADVTPDAIRDWAEKQAKPFRDVGYEPTDMAVFAMSDEPGWYYPGMFRALTNSVAGMQRFRDYLRDQGMKPRDLGAKSWDAVFPLGRSGARDLASRRLFYWTMRFFPWDSSRHFAISTRALEAAFYTNMPILVNWNFFAGRFYVPGPVANNGDKQHPDSAMGGHDWLEFGRMRGCTMLWTEDWFGDGQASQWSYYCSRMRAGARKGGVEFGGYVIPRTAGQLEEGILQKIMAIVGCGGKAIKYFVFGPEYNFPGNCYSANVKVLPAMAEAHRMIGAAESLLWPGRMPAAQTAILMPRSAMPWDALDQALPRQVQDATMTGLNSHTVDYMAETYNLYQALQHANIPVDMVEEEDLSPEGLAGVKVLYVTEPNVPEEMLARLARWVEQGGMLVTVSGACQADRYQEPLRWMAKSMGVEESSRPRQLLPNLNTVTNRQPGNGICGPFVAAGPVSALTRTNRLDVWARFGDGRAAVVSRSVKKGRVVHFGWMPGISYVLAHRADATNHPGATPETVRDWIVHPTRLAGVVSPVVVNVPKVETPMLVSSGGVALTLLNWSGKPQESVEVSVRLDFQPRVVRAIREKVGPVTSADGITRFSIPLKSADVVLMER